MADDLEGYVEAAELDKNQTADTLIDEIIYERCGLTDEEIVEDAVAE